MKRLTEKNINTPEFFDKQFEEELNRYRGLKYIDLKRFELLAKDFIKGRFLDLGVWNCPIVLELKKKSPNSEFWVLDFSYKIIEFWRKSFPHIQSVLADSQDTPFRDEYFDYIIAGELLEHMNSPENQIAEIFRILKKGGTFSFSVPMKESKKKRVSPEHIWSFNESDIRKLFLHYGKLELMQHNQLISHLIGFVKKLGKKYGN